MHRLIWFLQTGEWPPEQIDHINGNKSDNRWSNLRLATNSQNKMNAAVRSDSRTRVKGVYFDPRENRKNRPYRAHVKGAGKRVRLGYFRTLEEAETARKAAAIRLQGAFAWEAVS